MLAPIPSTTVQSAGLPVPVPSGLKNSFTAFAGFGVGEAVGVIESVIVDTRAVAVGVAIGETIFVF